MSLSDVLPDDWIDLCPGEAYSIREALLSQFSIPEIKFEKERYVVRLDYYSQPHSTSHLHSYPRPSGYNPLVQKLQDKHGAPVIITNGAKQALAAIFYALKQSGRKTLGFDLPVWGLIPPLAKAHGLDYHYNNYDCYLSVMPNNPDGKTYDLDYAKKLARSYKEDKVVFIHDAAYYTPVYMPEGYQFGNIGDMQVFSFSKMFGLSSLRLGYIVFHDSTYYKAVQDYMEMMTVGVSTYSQIYMYELLNEMVVFKDKKKKFIVDARNALYEAKFLSKLIRKDILSVPENICQTVGMFLWAKLLKKNAFKDAKVNVLYGSGQYSGDDEYVRINLAAPHSVLREMIRRVNQTV